MSNPNKEMDVLRNEARDTAEGTRAGIYYEPPVDIYETPDALHLMADMPGISPDGLDIDLNEGVLTLTGRQEIAEEGRVTHREFRPGNFHRRFRLSGVIDQAGIEASLEHGVLSLRLPKAERARPRKIQVQAR